MYTTRTHWSTLCPPDFAAKEAVLRLGALILSVLTLASCGGAAAPTPPPPTEPLVVVNASGSVASGFNILVNTDSQRTDWVVQSPDGLNAAYPPGQQFGFVACVLAGDATPGRRPFRDLSAYRSVKAEIRGAIGGERVEVGIKDNTDPDDGTESKRAENLTGAWKDYEFPLSSFSSADPRRLYLVFELVFSGGKGDSVFFRNVRYVP